MTDMTIAKTILEQLGGNKFVAMTGARKLTARENALSFQIGRNASKANYIKITLTPSDTYTISFNQLHKSEIKELKKVEGVYCDQLQGLFTETTGLYTSL